MYQGGNKLHNNCDSCNFDLIFRPGDENSKNCVAKCPYYYYFNNFGQYKCTKSNYCPDEANLLIYNSTECTKKCNSNIYKYQYSGQCLNECPSGTKPDNNNLCVDINKNVCSLSEFRIDFKEDNLLNEYIDFLSKNYAKEFSYTDKRIEIRKNQKYKIILYKKKFRMY